jgi:hypothetical protein
MKRIYVLQVLVIVGVILTLFVNYLAIAGYLNGVKPTEISDALLTKFTPANYAFAIWSVIYTFVIGFAIYQTLPSQRDNPKLEGGRPLEAGQYGLRGRLCVGCFRHHVALC